LMDLLKDTRGVRDGESVAAAASGALAKMGKPAAEACFAALTKGPPREQSDMLRRTIGQFRDPGSIDTLILYMKDLDPKIRDIAVTSVRYSNDPRLVVHLVHCFKDSDRYVRLSAVDHFRMHRDCRVVESLMNALVHEDDTMQVFAAEALGAQGDRRAIPVLLARIQDDTEDSATQRESAAAVGKIGGPGTFERLVEILAQRDDLLHPRPGAKTALDDLRRIVSSDQWGRRFGAAGGLGHLGDPRGAEALRMVLGNVDEPYSIRIAAAESLARIEGKKAFPLLTDVVTRPSELSIVRFQVAARLVQASDGAIDDVGVVAALADWGYARHPIKEKQNIETAIAALEAVANRATNAEVRAAAQELLAEARKE
jgi:HEAT repeat protein